MTPTPLPSEPDDRRPLLAGLADGELGSTAAKLVGRWADTDPRASDVLAGQVALSRAGTDLWDATRPESPAEDVWAEVGRAVRRRVVANRAGTRTRRKARLLVGAVAAGLGALGVWAANEPAPVRGGVPAVARVEPRQPQPTAVAILPVVPAPAADPLAEFDVLPMARFTEVGVTSYSFTPAKGVEQFVSNTNQADAPMLFAIVQRP